MRTVAYLRISQDRSNVGAGVQRQQDDIAARAAREGWEDVEYVQENDRSALRRRPEFEALLEAVDAGKVGRVAAWSPERLIKAKRDEYRLYEACRKHDVIIAYIQAPDIDLSTPSGRLVADIMGASARLETELKSERQRAANRQSAERGGDPGGGRAFGYVRRFADAENRRGTVRIEVVPEEAALIREAARRILGGDSLSNLARDWAARGVTSVTGGRWDASNIRQIGRASCRERVELSVVAGARHKRSIGIDRTLRR